MRQVNGGVLLSKGAPADEADKGAYRLGRPTSLAVRIFVTRTTSPDIYLYPADQQLIGSCKIVHGGLEFTMLYITWCSGSSLC